MKETKNVPQLRFSGFDDDWKEVIFSEIFTERHDISTITKDYPQLSFTIAEGVIRPEDRKTNQRDFLIKDKENKQYLKTELNDIIYNPANVVFGAIHRNGLGNGVLSPIYKIFYTNEDSVFLEGIVRNPEFIRKIANQTEGTVTKLKTLKPENFLQMRSFISPYLQEQQKIGAFLSHVDSLIQAKTKKLESLKAVKKSLLQKCFPKAGEKVPKMRFAGFSGEWEEMKLGDVITVNSGKDYKHLDEGNIPVYGTGGYMLSVNAKLSDMDAVGIGRKGTIDNPLYLKAPFWTVDTLFFMTTNNGFNLKFIYNLSQNIDWKSMDESTSIPSLSKNNIVDVDVLIPATFEEQQKIGQFFSKYDSLVSAQQKEIDKLKDIKKSLLQKMFV